MKERRIVDKKLLAEVLDEINGIFKKYNLHDIDIEMVNVMLNKVESISHFKKSLEATNLLKLQEGFEGDK